MITLSALAAMTDLAIAVNANSLIGIYPHTRFTTSVDSGVTAAFGPHENLQFDVALSNEEGDLTVHFPKGVISALEVELHRNGEPIPTSAITVTWSETIQEYEFRPETHSEFSLGPSGLRPGDGLRLEFDVEPVNGIPFEAASYVISVRFRPGAAVRDDGSAWTGRGGKGSHKFQIRNVESDDDLIAKYVIAASMANTEGNHEAALEYYTKIGEVSPDHPASYSGIGDTLFRMKEYERAIPYLERASTKLLEDGSHSFIPHSLAYCYVAAGEQNKALEILTMFRSAASAATELERMKKVFTTNTSEPGN
jgi:hypothetical protein